MVVAIALGLAVLTAGTACTPTDDALSLCFDAGRPVLDVPSDHDVPYPGPALEIANHTTVNAFDEVFDDTELTSEGFGVGVKFHDVVGTRSDLCFVGGFIFTHLDAEATPWETWHRIAGMTVHVPNVRIVGTAFFNEGDMIGFGKDATDWKVIGVRTDGGGMYGGGFIHDDCIENDSMNSGTIYDVKLDGCQVFLSSLSPSTKPIDGHRETVEVANSLIRVQPFHNSFDPAKYGFDQHGGFFKFGSDPATEGVPPKLVVRNSTFRADSPAPYGGNVNGFLALPPRTACWNVTLINSDTWPERDLRTWQDQCTDISYGTTADWNAKVAKWDADHPISH